MFSELSRLSLYDMDLIIYANIPLFIEKENQ